MIFNKNSRRKKKVLEFFEYIEEDVIFDYNDSEPIRLIKNRIFEGRKLVENNEWGIAFENVAEELIEHFIIINRRGEAIAKEVIKLCKLNPNWIQKLRRLHSDAYLKGSWSLIDCEKLAKENKYTFYKPSKNITSKLKVGNLVKLNFQFKSANEQDPSGERMWVKITEVNQDKFKGILDNNPFYISDLYFQDFIEFHHKHIIDHDLGITEPNLIDKYYDRCFVTSKVLYENARVNYLYREEPMELDEERDYIDTGWRILAGDETDEYMDQVGNIHLVSLGAILSKDDSFIDVLDSKIGASFSRNPVTNQFEQVLD